MTPYLPGLHDRGGEHLLGGRGWVLVTEAIGCDPHDGSGADYTDLVGQGLEVMVRLNNGYHPGGTLPLADRYGDFAARCANFVAASRGCTIWIIANETNHAQERPGGEVITPARYVSAFVRCRRAIKGVRSGDIVIPAPVAPWNWDTGDWLAYQREVLRLVECDGIAIHTYGPHGELWMESMPERRYGFWAYRDLLEAMPADKRGLPVYLTEMNPNRPWSDDMADAEWVREAYAEIDRWNRAGGQAIHCAILYRWSRDDQWHIDGKPGPQAGLRDAVRAGYVVPVDGLAEEVTVNLLPMDGRLMDLDAFRAHLETVDLSWVRRVVMHHTADPDEETWTHWGGWPYWKLQLRSYYSGLDGWEAMPHLVAGPDGLGLLWSLGGPGRGVGGGALEVGCLHIETVGRYTDHLPEGAILDNVVGAAAAILNAAGLGMDALTHHTAVVGPGVTDCPGAAWRAAWGWFAGLVAAARIEQELPPAEPLPQDEPDGPAAWLMDKVRWWTEELARALQGGREERARAILDGLISREYGLMYRLERRLKG